MELQLHPKQGQALLTPATEVLYGGAAAGGKSHLMRVAAIAWSTDISGLQTYLFRRKYPELYKNHMRGPTSFPNLLRPWIARGLVEIVRTEIRFWNNSIIHLCHCHTEDDVENYHGPEIHVLLIDELTTFTDYIYRYLRSRVRLGALKLPPRYEGQFPRILASSNPGKIGHNWVKKAFIAPAPEGVVWRTPADEGGMLRQFIRARLEDNPTASEQDPNYVDRLKGLGAPELVRAMLEGDWDIVAGGMFDDVWRAAVHVIEPFEIPYSWYKDRSFDWGSSRPFAVLWWAESDGTTAPNGRTYPAGTLFLVAEWYGTNGRPNEGVKMLATEIADGIVAREADLGYEFEPGPADSSIYDTVNGVCIAEDMDDHGVEWTRADKSPGSRKNGWERMRGYLKASLEAPQELPGLYVFNTCRSFIDIVPTLPRDDRKLDDLDTDSEDHLADAARYRISHPAPPLPSLPVAGGERDDFSPGWPLN